MQQELTLRRVWRDYIRVRRASKQTIRQGDCMLNKCVSEWLDIDIRTITKKLVKERYASLVDTPAMANSTFRLIRTLYNFAIAEYYEDEKEEQSLVTHNPVHALSKPVKLWYPDKSRRRHIPLRLLWKWWNAVLMLENTVVRDYLILIVLTGFRHEEASELQWSNVDFDCAIIHLEDTKNHEPHSLPIGPFLIEMLRERKRFSVSSWVFPSNESETGHMVAPYKVIDIVEAAIGLSFSPHDLRRTFNKIAIDIGVEEYTRKRLLNHKFQDVTSKHYSPPDPEDLRYPMEIIERHALRLAGHHREDQVAS